jgi:large subunit ribosomal protein L7/L12
MADVKNLAEQLVGLTVKEVQDLADFLKSEYGIEPAAAAVMVSADGGGAGAAAAEEQTAFNCNPESRWCFQTERGEDR